MIHLLVVAALMAGVPEPSAKLSDAQSRAAQTHVRELEKLTSRAETASLEQVFMAAVDIRELLAGFSSSRHPSIEDLPADDYARLQQQLTGIILNREEVILAEPDPQYFSRLATEYGGPVDRQFFALYGATFPESVWPVYLTQQTDSSGCTDFGEGHLVRSYREWTRFRASHPGRYEREVERLINHIQEAVVSTCACGDRDSVLRELSEFAAAFPQSAVNTAARDRIRDLERGASPVRFHCISG